MINSIPTTMESVEEDLCTTASSDGSVEEEACDELVFELSSLMVHLPIKKGLSKYFQGKTQSFSSLSDVVCLEDLAKNKAGLRKRRKAVKKACRSFKEGENGKGKERIGGYGLYSKTIEKKLPRRGTWCLQ